MTKEEIIKRNMGHTVVDLYDDAYQQGALDQRKIDIENACAEVNAILSEFGIKSYDRSRNLKRLRKVMED